MVLLAIASWFPGQAHALRVKLNKTEQLQIDIATSTVFEYITRNDTKADRTNHGPQYMGLRNKLDLSVGYKGFIIGGRLDTFNFFQDRHPCPSGFLECKGQYIPEKLFLKYRNGGFNATLGDFYLTISHGVALSIRKVDEFGLDTTLRGGRITYRNKGTEITLAGGVVNNTNFEPTEQMFLKDINDFVAVGQFKQLFASIVTAEAHYVFAYHFPKFFGDGSGELTSGQAHVLGATIQLHRIAKKIDIAFEANAIYKDLQSSTDYGYSFYASFNGYFFPATVRFEATWNRNFAFLRQFEHQYHANPNVPTDPPFRVLRVDPLLFNNPPSLELQTLDTHGDTSDIRGFRFRVDYNDVKNKVIYYFNYVMRVGFSGDEELPRAPWEPAPKEPPAPPPIPGEEAKLLWIHHVYAGADVKVGIFDINLLTGWRSTIEFPNWNIFHIEASVAFQSTPQQAIKLLTRYQNHDKGDDLDPKKYNIFDFQLTWSYSKWFSISFLFAYSNEDKEVSPIPGWNKDFFLAGEIKVNLFDRGSITLVGGRTRGGIRCTGGVCREFPAFDGIQSELQLRF